MVSRDPQESVEVLISCWITDWPALGPLVMHMVLLSASLYANGSTVFGLVEPTVEPASLPEPSVVMLS